jgi:hypothetical protein
MGAASKGPDIAIQIIELRAALLKEGMSALDSEANIPSIFRSVQWASTGKLSALVCLAHLEIAHIHWWLSWQGTPSLYLSICLSTRSSCHGLTVILRNENIFHPYSASNPLYNKGLAVILLLCALQFLWNWKGGR